MTKRLILWALAALVGLGSASLIITAAPEFSLDAVVRGEPLTIVAAIG
jgi:hypothetical protein